MPGLRRELLIFDFDGTLANSFPAFTEALTAAIAKFGLRRVRDEDVELLRSLGAREIIAHLGIPLWKVPRIGAFVHAAMKDSITTVSLFPQSAEMLRALAEAGIQVAVVSSNSEENVRHVLGAELSNLITAFECGAGLFGKAGKFTKVLRRTKVEPGAALSIGDEIRDLEASMKLGIPFGVVAWGYTHADAVMRAGAQFRFDTADQIIAAAVTGVTTSLVQKPS